MIKSINLTKKDRGFTIVELLVVIVVIGILAAITIVSYAGITARANSASAQSAANNAIAKVNAYAVDSTSAILPGTFAVLTGAASTTTYYLSGVTFLTQAAVMSAQPSTPSTIQFVLCGVNASAAATTYATIAQPAGVSGVKIYYWDYANTAAASYSVGTITGTWNTYNITCYPSTT